MGSSSPPCVFLQRSDVTRLSCLRANIPSPGTSRGTMTVSCAGDCRLLEQLGEKQDFECALTALDLPHEDFALKVVRVIHRELGPQWSQDYRVTVTRLGAGFRHVYIGGPRHCWVRRCADDLVRHGQGAHAGGRRTPRRAPSGRCASEAASGEQHVAK
jgi:hypothetical protein